MGKKIFILAGEPSGDELGSKLIRDLRLQSPDIEVIGIGGPLMIREGLNSMLPMEELSVIGLAEIVSQLPRLMRLIRGVVEEIEKQDVDAVITVDLPDFNFQVASKLKKRGKSKAKIIHYVAPTVWAWRPGRAKKIAKFLDGLMCLFPFEPDYFKKVGLNAKYVGHPVVEIVPDPEKQERYRVENDIREDETVVGFFYGSRESELKSVSQLFSDTCMVIKENYGEFTALIPTLPHLEYELIKLTEGLDCRTIVSSSVSYKWQALGACDVAIAVSGTVGLELSYANIPHVITYKMNPISWLLIKQLVKVKFAHLTNILLDRPAVPEYLQGQAKPEKLAEAVITLLRDEEARAAQRKEFDALRVILGEGQKITPSTRAARYVLGILGEAPKKAQRPSSDQSAAE